jgi:hypothetical protein
MTEFSLTLDAFELGLLYGLIGKETVFAEEDVRIMYESIQQKIVKIRRSMGKSAAN